MNFSEIENLFKEVPSYLEKIEWWIGKDRSVTTQISEYIHSMNPTSPDILPICSLLLLEKFDSMVEIIRNILLKNPDRISQFIEDMLNSPFYNQRMAIPRIIVDLGSFMKGALLRCFQDQCGIVIKEAALSLRKYSTLPFSEEELLEIATSLNRHEYDYVQSLVPEILIHLKEKSFLISEICLSKSWRKRLAMATRANLFKPQERSTIYTLLHEDPEESIRSALVENLSVDNSSGVENMRDYAEIFIRDPSEKVRRQVIKAIGNLSEFQDILEKAVVDPSWAVRKELLCIHNENIYETISLPLITSLPSNFDWRIKVEILESISQIAEKNPPLIKRCLTDILFSYLTDQVAEIREKTSEVLRLIVEKADWAREWEERIFILVTSNDYLKRMSVTTICASFDRRFQTSFMLLLLRDKIPNVRLKALERLEKEDLREEVVSAIREMERDEYVEKEISRLLE